MGGSLKTDVPSMKSGEIMDSSQKTDVSSIKSGKIMDNSLKTDVPSMKSGKIMDSSQKMMRTSHLNVYTTIRNVNHHQDDI